MKRWKDINWLWVAGTFSVVYCAIVGSALGWSRSWNFFTTDPKLNEAGDFLAGVFAPLALIWLVAAVLTQRQELNETRDQFTENQKVVDAQLKTINSQNELLTLQHQQSVENAKKAYKLSLFDKRFKIYSDIRDFPAAHSTKDYDELSHGAMVDLSHQASFVFDQKIADWLREIAREILNHIDFRDAYPFEEGPDGYGNHIILSNDYNKRLQAERERRKKEITQRFGIEDALAKLQTYMDVSDQYIDLPA